MSHRHYKNAPIMEALVNIRTSPSAQSTLKRIELIENELAAQFPVSLPIIETMVEIKSDQDGIKVGGAPSPSRVGSRLETSGIPKRVVLIKPDVFSFSWLAPYAHWEDLAVEARAGWRKYNDIMQPTEVTRVAVKYVSRFDIPAVDTLRAEQYFNVYTNVPDTDLGSSVSLTMSASFMQVQMPQLDLGSVVIITTGLVPPPSEGLMSFLLDIDVIRLGGMVVNEDAVWQIIEALHERQYQIFEKCVTDKARGLIG